MPVFNNPRNYDLVAGDTFIGSQFIQFTATEASEIQDGEGNTVITMDSGKSYEGQFPSGVFTLVSGAAKIYLK